MKKTVLFITLAVVLLMGLAFAQDSSDLAKTMSKLAGGATQGYMGPAGSAFGNNLNSGWFHKAPQSKIFGIDIELGVVVAGTFVSDENKTFSVNNTFRFDDTQSGSIANLLNSDPGYNALSPGLKTQVRTNFINQLKQNDVQVGFSGPTLLGGASDPLLVTFNPGTVTLQNPVSGAPTTYNIGAFKDTIKGVKSFDIPIVPLPLPQISLGTVYGTMVTLRGAPIDIPAGKFGKVRFFGFGIQHNLGMWLPIPIVDVALSYYSTGLSIKSKQNGKEQELIKTKASGFGANVSKQLGFGFLNVTPYAGFGIEQSKTTIAYDAPLNTPAGPTTIPFSIEFDGVNKSRLTVGLSIRILLININADYNIGKTNSATAGLFLAF